MQIGFSLKEGSKIKLEFQQLLKLMCWFYSLGLTYLRSNAGPATQACKEIHSRTITILQCC